MLLKFGELALKGRNRPLFVNALERNLRRLTSDLGPLEVRHRGGVLILTGDMPEDALVERCLALPGVSVVQPALRCERDAAAGADAAVALLRGLVLDLLLEPGGFRVLADEAAPDAPVGGPLAPPE